MKKVSIAGMANWTANTTPRQTAFGSSGASPCIGRGKVVMMAPAISVLKKNHTMATRKAPIIFRVSFPFSFIYGSNG